MGNVMTAKKDRVIDARIDEFCKTSADLLSEIHVRCEGNSNGGKKQKKRGRKRKALVAD